MLIALLAAVSYIPLFLTRIGSVAADTKEYLYLDPGRLTTGAASMWDPNTGLGTVTHQNIGYLLPMGPYYTLVSWLGIPMWVGQRIWMGTLMFAAGAGVAYCARRLGLEGPGRAVAAFAYTLSPYILDYLDRISAILMPWAALGWMIGLVAMSARTGRWRYPALFALVVALVGGVNATSILLVITAPAVWLAYAVWVTHEVSLRRALAISGRLALLCVLVSIWWAAGLWAEDRYGINILRVTETLPTVSSTSSASEVLRGLGYWYFYGWDKVQPWTLQAPPYTQSPWLIAVSFAVPVAALVLGLVTRWVYRAYSLALIGVGAVVAVGAFPFTDPSFFGAVIKGASAGSTLALAMRSVDRIVPVVVMGLALLMGSGVTALHLRRPSIGLVAGGVSLALVGANLPALWTGGLIASNLSRPAHLPGYWTDAAAYLNSSGSATRVFGLPGEDFAAYSWGVTEDPVPPGLLDRPYVSRQVVPAGTPASANLVQAIDEPLQQGTLDLKSLVPVARLMSVGQILLQSDLQYERYHLPLPQVLYSQLTSARAGLGAPTSFGAPNPAPQIRYPLNSEARLGLPTGTPQPPALSVFDVPDPRPIVRAESARAPLLLAGDGSGVVEAAGAGLLNGDQTILYAADAAKDAQGFAGAMARGATLVLTDTNPLATYMWGSLQANVGQVEQPGVKDPSNNPSDYALPVFPGETPADQTVADVGGVKSVVATQYGDSLTFTPEDKPLNAFDGNPSTAWAFGAHEPVKGIALEATFLHPVTTDHLTLHQMQQFGQIKRRITSVTLSFDGKKPLTVPLTAASLSAPGQTVSFPARTFSQLDLTVDGATGGADKRYDGLPQVGFTQISVPGVAPATESLRLPTDLLTQAGSASLGHPLDILMSRQRVTAPPRQDPELFMSRTFDLPTSRTFSISGTAEINAGDSDYLIDQLIGLNSTNPGTPGATVVSANSSTRLDGDRYARANQAVDGNPSTAWIAETGPQAGEWLSVNLSKPITFDHLDLQVLNDGRHSLPSRITISTGSGSRTVDLTVPPVGQGRPENSTSTIPVSFPAVTGSSVRVTVDAVHQVRSLDYYSTFAGITDILPVGIAELGLPGVTQPAPPARVPSVCTAGLLKVDGEPVDVEVTGTTSDALAGHQLSIAPCGNSIGGVKLGPGRHTVTTSPRLPSGWSIDQLWLASGPGGGPASLASTVGGSVAVGASRTGAGSGSTAVPSVQVVSQDRTGTTVKVHTTGSPFWLVLGQSYSHGWTASMGGKSLGPPKLVDAFANGWYVPAHAAGQTVVIHVRWSPQSVIWAALVVSAASILLCVMLAVWPVREASAGGWGRRRARRKAPGRPGVERTDSANRIWGRAVPDSGVPVRRWRACGVWGSPPEPATWRAFSALSARPWPSLRIALGAAVAWGAAVALVSRPVIGAVAGAFVVLGVRVSWGRVVARFVSVGVLVALPVYVVHEQVRHHYWPDIGWPANISSANDLAWFGLAILGSDVVAGAIQRRHRARRAT